VRCAATQPASSSQAMPTISNQFATTQCSSIIAAKSAAHRDKSSHQAMPGRGRSRRDSVQRTTRARMAQSVCNTVSGAWSRQTKRELGEEACTRVRNRLPDAGSLFLSGVNDDDVIVSPRKKDFFLPRINLQSPQVPNPKPGKRGGKCVAMRQACSSRAMRTRTMSRRTLPSPRRRHPPPPSPAPTRPPFLPPIHLPSLCHSRTHSHTRSLALTLTKR